MPSWIRLFVVLVFCSHEAVAANRIVKCVTAGVNAAADTVRGVRNAVNSVDPRDLLAIRALEQGHVIRVGSARRLTADRQDPRFIATLGAPAIEVAEGRVLRFSPRDLERPQFAFVALGERVLYGVELNLENPRLAFYASANRVVRTFRDPVLTAVRPDIQIARGVNGVEHIFTRRMHPTLGEGWTDPSGVTWYDVLRDASGQIETYVQSSEYMRTIGRPLPDGKLGALEKCLALGGELPKREDFARLRRFFGSTTADTAYEGTGYRPQILPNLDRYFRSASVHPYNSIYAYVFGGREGYIYYVVRGFGIAVRCVSRP